MQDEPLSALADAQTRALLIEEFASLIASAAITTVYVTRWTRGGRPGPRPSGRGAVAPSRAGQGDHPDRAADRGEARGRCRSRREGAAHLVDDPRRGKRGRSGARPCPLRKRPLRKRPSRKWPSSDPSPSAPPASRRKPSPGRGRDAHRPDPRLAGGLLERLHSRTVPALARRGRRRPHARLAVTGELWSDLSASPGALVARLDARHARSASAVGFAIGMFTLGAFPIARARLGAVPDPQDRARAAVHHLVRHRGSLEDRGRWRSASSSRPRSIPIRASTMCSATSS